MDEHRRWAADPADPFWEPVDPHGDPAADPRFGTAASAWRPYPPPAQPAPAQPQRARYSPHLPAIVPAPPSALPSAVPLAPLPPVSGRYAVPPSATSPAIWGAPVPPPSRYGYVPYEQRPAAVLVAVTGAHLLGALMLAKAGLVLLLAALADALSTDPSRPRPLGVLTADAYASLVVAVLLIAGGVLFGSTRHRIRVLLTVAAVLAVADSALWLAVSDGAGLLMFAAVTQAVTAFVVLFGAFTRAATRWTLRRA